MLEVMLLQGDAGAPPRMDGARHGQCTWLPHACPPSLAQVALYALPSRAVLFHRIFHQDAKIDGLLTSVPCRASPDSSGARQVVDNLQPVYDAVEAFFAARNLLNIN